MADLDCQRILLGVAGGIAAYKSVEVCRQLQQRGLEVRVVMTKAATTFVQPLTFAAITGYPVVVDWADLSDGVEHIKLARWADVILLAPTTADLMARCALGLADDPLTTICLASTASVWMAPAMNREMWVHPATQANSSVLEARGVRMLGPGYGDQACGEHGAGRMLEPVEIVDQLLATKRTLAGVRVMLTAGPTREPLDPVRFLGNRSSGRMGYALAQAFVQLGAMVTLVSGPTSLAIPSGVDLVSVNTALEMHQAVMARVAECQLFVGCAAVADYRPSRPATAKIKKSTEELTINLVRNPDILAEVATHYPRPFCVGFAAETNDLERYARCKLVEKKLDMIAANLVGDDVTGGFEQADNALLVLWQAGQKQLPMMNKRQLAEQLAALIAQHFLEHHHASA